MFKTWKFRSFSTMFLFCTDSSNDIASVSPSRGSSKTRPKRPPSDGSTSNSAGSGSVRQGPQGGQRPHKKRPSNRRPHEKTVRSSTTTTTTTTTTPKYNYPQTTPEPPTTPDPGSGESQTTKLFYFKNDINPDITLVVIIVCRSSEDRSPISKQPKQDFKFLIFLTW